MMSIAAALALVSGCKDNTAPASDGSATGSATDTGAGSTGGADTAADGTAGGPVTSVRLWVTPELELGVGEMVRLAPWVTGVEVKVDPDPLTAAAGDTEAGVFPVAVAQDQLDCEQCFAILPGDGQGLVVAGGDLLGAQYGVDELFERAGARFFTPFAGYAPEELAPAVAQVDPIMEPQSPEIGQRGIHVHTLHPIEALWAFWVPSDENLERAKTIIDYYIKLRANYLQWAGLDDIVSADGALAPWRDHTAAIIEYAHGRGMEIGVNVQMVGESNLQHAYDLADTTGTTAEENASFRDRLTTITDGLPFDRITLSFGEFIPVDPDSFIDRINRVYDALQEVAPGTEMATLIHVGNTDALHVQYMGMDYIYYLLAQFANPEIVQWVHSVMYFDLYQPTDGAYGHTDFSEHKQLILDLTAQGRRVGYHPETAYWVAFDNSVPTYMPVYLDSRRLDIAGLADDGAPLSEHYTFSTGFEWGYWQNDYAVFRWNWALTDDTESVLQEMFAPFGDDGATLAGIIAQLGALQSQRLIEDGLGPYLAGRDISIDASFEAGVVSQPDRMGFVDLSELSTMDRAAFVDGPLAELDMHVTELQDFFDQVDALQMPGGEHWLNEVRDGIEIDMQRTAYMAALLHASAAVGDGEDPDPWLKQADDAFAAAGDIVARRHADLADPRGNRLISGDVPNPTRYSNGYLEKADTLCYWGREREKVDNLIAGVTGVVSPCFEIGG